MSFIEQIQAYLAHLGGQSGSPRLPAAEEVTRLRLHLRARFEHLQDSGRTSKRHHVALDFQRWNDDLEDLAYELSWGIADLPIAEDERDAALALALDAMLSQDIGRGIGRQDISPPPVWLASLEDVARSAGRKLQEAGWWQRRRTIMRYAVALQLTQGTGREARITSIGEVLLRLQGRDAIRWILALEIVQSLGPDDIWRMSRGDAASLGKIGWMPAYADDVPWSMRLLDRCVCLHLLEEEEQVEEDDDRGPAQTIYSTTGLGATLLQEAANQDTPFILLARSLAADQTQAVLAPTGNPWPGMAAEASMQHTRMVAHEIRNALVPVSVALDRLWSTLRRTGEHELLGEPRDTIDAGIARVFRFLTDSVQITRLTDAPREDFELLPALREAIAALDLPPRQPIEPQAAPDAAGRLVHGHRRRFVTAVVNILRNAVQVGGDDVTLLVHVAVLPGSRQIRIAIDDDGPGIAPAHRDSVFQNGVSHRVHGMGHGLWLVRWIIEREMTGKITCEDGTRGGACFVIELPLARGAP